MALIEIDGLPMFTYINSMVIFYGKLLNNQMVIDSNMTVINSI